MLRAPAVAHVTLTAVLALTAGCASGGVEQARELARQSCLYPVPDVPSPFDPATADQVTLDKLAVVARDRADLAGQAAIEDERWAVLADAAVAIAASADLLRSIRASGESIAVRMPPAVWDQVKYASDAFLVECRPFVSVATAG